MKKEKNKSKNDSGSFFFRFFFIRINCKIEIRFLWGNSFYSKNNDENVEWFLNRKVRHPGSIGIFLKFVSFQLSNEAP